MRRDQRILPVRAVVAGEAHRLIRVVRIGHEAAAEQAVVPVRDDVLLELVELGAGDRNAARAERRSGLGRVGDPSARLPSTQW